MSTSSGRMGHGDFYGIVRRSHAAEGIAISHRIAAGHVEPHAHDDAHFVWVTGGRYVTTARGDFPNRQPVFVYNPPGTTHRDHFEAGIGSFFTVSLAGVRLAELLAGLALPQDAVHIDGFAPRGTIRSLIQECWTGPDSKLLLEALCLELLCSLEARAYAAKFPDWLARAREILHDCAAEDLSLRDVAQRVGVHPIHLTRTFRTFFRCTPGEYLRSCRLERAADILTRTKLPLAAVALASGFADQSHFTRRFSHAFGVAPGEYRRLTS